MPRILSHHLRMTTHGAVFLFPLALLFAGTWGNPWRRQVSNIPAPAVPADETAGTHREVEMLDVRFRRFTAMTMDRQGRLLAGDSESKEIKVIEPAGTGEVVKTVRLPFGPEALDVGADGVIYCGGQGKLARLSPAGRIMNVVDAPDNGRSATPARRRAARKAAKVSGLAVTDRHVFAAFGSGASLGAKSKLFRFDLDFSHPKLLAEGLRTCCRRCDLKTRNGRLFLAENGVHRIVVYDADGRVLEKWGKRSRTDPAGFGSCCNPMNLCFGADGTLYTAESGLGRVKRYTPDGRFLGVVGTAGVPRFNRAGAQAAACSNIAIACAPDGRRIYVMDYALGRIRVLEQVKAR